MGFPTNTSNPSLYPHNALRRDSTKVDFGRNQLSPDSIGFLPLTISYKNACTQNLFGPPRNVSFASPYPWLDRLVSGRALVTSACYDCSPPYVRELAFAAHAPRKWLMLATKAHSLASYSKLTMQRRSAASQHNREISGLCTLYYEYFSTFLHSTIRYRSQVVFRVGS